jgi:hypothetical protein
MWYWGIEPRASGTTGMQSTKWATSLAYERMFKLFSSGEGASFMVRIPKFKNSSSCYLHCQLSPWYGEKRVCVCVCVYIYIYIAQRRCPPSRPSLYSKCTWKPTTLWSIVWPGHRQHSLSLLPVTPVSHPIWFRPSQASECIVFILGQNSPRSLSHHTPAIIHCPRPRMWQDLLSSNKNILSALRQHLRWQELWAAVLMRSLFCLWLWALDSGDWGLRETWVQKRGKGWAVNKPVSFSVQFHAVLYLGSVSPRLHCSPPPNTPALVTFSAHTMPVQGPPWPCNLKQLLQFLFTVHALVCTCVCMHVCVHVCCISVVYVHIFGGQGKTFSITFTLYP